MTPHVNPGTDTTINPVIINDTHRQKPLPAQSQYEKVVSEDGTERYNPVQPPHPAPAQNNKGELVYGTITKNGEDWRMRLFDAGMGETEYRIFKNEEFFAQFDNRKNADTIMELMTIPDVKASHTSSSQQRIEQKFNSTELLLLANDEWKRREERKHNHENAPWVSGFINGFCTDKKWARKYVDALLQAGRK